MPDHDPPTQPSTPAEGNTQPERLEDFPRLLAGDEIGPYRLVRRLGEGGMGVVWLAEQQAPIRRRVALKIIKQGMDTRQVVARFETERQVLARLDHPHIARVYDAGVTNRGRPYFVLEYVPGVPITEYCDEHRLSVAERIALFLEVCEGVQHAHRNAIIHRDLKPHNVLVAVQEDRPVPKIIDFGVAKATDQTHAEHTIFTQLGQMVGTPEYMSPEQAAMSSLDIDTRTDLYSLGVLLYELLTGHLPFDSHELRQQSIDEIRRRIREDEPPLPSARVSRLGDETRVVARSQRSSPGKLISQLRGDLDWIVMKALDKDRNRRYGSPTELADDLRRHLNDEPVLASPPSLLYRGRKFVRRHTVGVAFATVTALLLVILAVTSTLQAGRIARERDRANAEAESARQVSEFLVGLFRVSEPGENRGSAITAREILDAGVARVRLDLAGQPATRATMMRTMGRVYTELSLFGEAESLLREAVALGAADPAVDRREHARGLYELAKLCAWTDRDAEAEELARRSLALREAALGREHPEVAESLNALGIALEHQGRLDAAAAAHERALRIREQAFGSDSEEVAITVHNLAIVHYFRGDLAAAERLYRRAADLELARGGRLNHGYATSLHTLAIVYQDQGRLDEALALEQDALAIREEVLGPDHHHVALSLCTLGSILRELGRPAEGEAPGRRALAIGETTLGFDHPETAWMRHNLVQTLAASGDLDRAAAVLEAALGPLEAMDEPLLVAGELDQLGTVRRQQGRLDEAAALHERAMDLAVRTAGLDDPAVGLALANLARVRMAQQRHVEAEDAFAQATIILADRRGPADRDRLDALRDYADLLRRMGRPDDAAAILAEVEAAAR
jgi:serine/threonine protein kinase/tetratricopeptide (TPR) repeat protein